MLLHCFLPSYLSLLTNPGLLGAFSEECNGLSAVAAPWPPTCVWMRREAGNGTLWWRTLVNFLELIRSPVWFHGRILQSRNKRLGVFVIFP